MDIEEEIVEGEDRERTWGEFFDYYRTEVLTAGISFGFLICIFVAAAVADLPVYSGMKSVYRTISGGDRLGTGNRILDCRKPKNRSAPYCQEWRARQKSTWRGIQRHGGGEAPPAFSLHGNE